MSRSGLWHRLTAAWAAFQRPHPATMTRLDGLLSVVPAVIYARRCDQGNAVTFVSGNIRTMLGYEVDEVLADPDFWTSHLHADDRERCAGTVAALMGLGRLELEYRLKAKDGSWRWLHDECVVLHDALGRPREIVGSCIDVTTRHQSEQALADSENQLRAAQTRLMDALESSDDAFSVFDANDRLVAFNSRYCEVYPSIADIIRPGVDFAQLLRTSALRRQYDGVSPESADAWVQERLERHHHPGAPFEQLLEDGRWLEIVERPTAEGGRVAIRRDITHRKRMEAALRQELGFKQALMDALPYPIYYKSRAGLYLGCNRAFADAVGQPVDQIVGKRIEDLYSPDRHAEFRCYDAELFAQGGVQSFESTYRWADGLQRQMIVVKSTYNDENGHVAGLIGTLIDITPLKRAEERLVQTAKLITLGQIASEVAHEINQPLSILRMTAENTLERLRRDGPDRETLETKLTVMVEQACRMGDMITHLRSFTHHQDHERQTLSPIPAIQAAVEGVRQRFELDDIAFTVDLPANGPSLTGQPNQLEQVVRALLENARDAVCARHLPGRRRIALSLRQQQQGLTLSVQDNGGGVAEDIWPRIYSPFFTTKKEGAGTGLGLSISANIVAAMGGQLSGRNANDGAVFEVVWPPHDDAPPPPLATIAPAPQPGKPQILVVDDEPLAVDCITDYLTNRDYAVTAAISPLDALALAHQYPFDLVLTDQRMPGMDGNVLIERLRDVRPGLPAILMSGGGMPLPPASGGPIARLSKPLVLDELGRTVADLLTHPSVSNDATTAAAAPTVPEATLEPARRLWLIGEITGHLLHDFGQPLNIIRLNAENALENLDQGKLNDDRLRRALSSTVEQCQRAQQLGQTLLAATRRPREAPARLAPLPVLRQALATIQDRIRMQGIVFSWHSPIRLPPVQGHPARLESALRQLLENACDALGAQAIARRNAQPPWQARLTVRAHGDGNELVVEIADNGTGIPPTVLDSLAGGGKGLGLAIAAGIAGEMGGKLDFTIDNGTRAIMQLPASQPRLFIHDNSHQPRLDPSILGWRPEMRPAEADAALLRGEWPALAPWIAQLRTQAPALPIIVAAALDDDQCRQAVAAGAMMVIAADCPTSELALYLEECIEAVPMD